MLTLRHAVFGLMCAACLTGCGGVPSEMTKKNEVVTWPALEALRAPEFGMGIIRSTQTGDYATLKTTLSDPKTEEVVKKFEDEPIPKQFASKAREEAKADVVKEYKLLISGGKSGAPMPELKKSVDAITQGLAKLSDPALK